MELPNMIELPTIGDFYENPIGGILFIWIVSNCLWPPLAAAAAALLTKLES
jgi:hypothetical protein